MSTARVFGCRRVAWNDALARIRPVKASNKLLGTPEGRTAQGPYQQVPKSADLSKLLITRVKRTPERAFLSVAPVGVMQQVLRDLDVAWKAYEESKTGRRNGPRVGPPRFKSRKDNRQTARFTRSDRFAVLDSGRLRLPKIGDVRVKWTRDLRRNFHHQWSHRLTRENQAVFTETLSVRGLARTRLAKSVHDAGWAQFVAMLEYKAIRRGRSFVKVDRHFPSSRICSACGFRDGPKPLHIRQWKCPNCGTCHDRDWNAGRNVRCEGRRVLAAGATEPSTPGPGAFTRQRAG
ncbi:RNA-guided endonuclease InsQ/TnpB family protein [Streptomyces violascens]|uniref:RNA-guided endonuclease InsQ/TnpB family protein n=1 Tax=Streptomyces violascens TaxID=67381 RepID=UPI0037B61747